jgi:nitroreductase
VSTDGPWESLKVWQTGTPIGGSARLATVELQEVIRRRRMVRSFSSEPIEAAVLDAILEAALRSPTAGNTGGTAWLVLEGPAETATYWDSTTDEAWRNRNRDRFEGLRRAPIVLLSYGSPAAYAERYAEPDKDDGRLSRGDWAVPYWFGDAAFGVMTVLLTAVDAGLGACVLGNFRGEAALAERLGVPDGWRFFCAVAVGRADGLDHPSRSLERRRPDAAARIRRSYWESEPRGPS